MNNIDLSRLGDNFQRIVNRYLWDPPPRNTDPMKTIWLLGQEYPPTPRPTLSVSASESTHDLSSSESTVTVDAASLPSNDELEQSPWPPGFMDDFSSRVWVTYRSDFPPIPRSPPKENSTMSLFTTLRTHLPEHSQGFTSDSGWGCMIRSGQCVLANALFNLHLGRDWRRGEKVDEERRLLSLFADDPKAPFSIHKFVRHGQVACEVNPGEWFGPSAASQCIQALTNAYEPAGLQVYVTRSGGDVYEDSFMKVAKPDGGAFKPTIILVAIRLGIRGVTSLYWEALKATVQMRQSVGIAGGRPSSSHYFVGVQGDRFFYMDPHICRPRFPLKPAAEYTADEIDSCYSTRLRTLDIRDMDPSMLLAFLIRDEPDWHEWRKGVCEVQGKSVVHVSDREPGLLGRDGPREGAIEEVEAFTDDEDDGGLQ
ncbi:putative cysteine protease atg4 [Geopyxis carbonaria]|nr:putative cysteine protease atg4 [Geopyxis carbonaria]